MTMRDEAPTAEFPQPIPDDEADRLAALRAMNLLDTEAESVFDDIVEIARYVCGVPISLVSLVDSNRQWFKSIRGLEATGTSREVSFCAHAIMEPDEVMIIPDATDDPVFANNALVTGTPNIRFYAGMPLRAAGGEAVGTLCVIDVVPRDITEEQLTALRQLARVAEAVMQLRVA